MMLTTKYMQILNFENEKKYLPYGDYTKEV